MLKDIFFQLSFLKCKIIQTCNLVLHDWAPSNCDADSCHNFVTHKSLGKNNGIKVKNNIFEQSF